MRECLPPEFTANEATHWLATRYQAPLKALAALERAGALIRLKRGLYAFSESFEPLAAAASLHGASYISFETALAYYGMIPERVPTMMSVVDGRPAAYDTPAGRFEYYSQARSLFALGMDLVFIGERPCPIANREKALLDTLARAGLRAARLSAREVLGFVREAMRLDPDALRSLSRRKLRRMAPLYRNWGPRRLIEALALEDQCASSVEKNHE